MNRAIICCGLFWVIGCTSAEPNRASQPKISYPNPVYPPLADRDAVARLLPGIGPYPLKDLSDGVEVVKVGPNKLRKVTVEEKLASLGARVEAGKLVDRNGREIFFWRWPEFGTDPGPYYLQRLREQFDNLKNQGTVIEIDYWPGAEKGAIPPIVC